MNPDFWLDYPLVDWGFVKTDPEQPGLLIVAFIPVLFLRPALSDLNALLYRSRRLHPVLAQSFRARG